MHAPRLSTRITPLRPPFPLPPSQDPVLQGNPIRFKLNDSDIEIDNGLVKSRDILASNGLLHSISTVFIPPDLYITTRKRGENTQCLITRTPAPLYTSPTGRSHVNHVDHVDPTLHSGANRIHDDSHEDSDCSKRLPDGIPGTHGRKHKDGALKLPRDLCADNGGTAQHADGGEGYDQGTEDGPHGGLEHVEDDAAGKEPQRCDGACGLEDVHDEEILRCREEGSHECGHERAPAVSYEDGDGVAESGAPAGYDGDDGEPHAASLRGASRERPRVFFGLEEEGKPDKNQCSTGAPEGLVGLDGCVGWEERGLGVRIGGFTEEAVEGYVGEEVEDGRTACGRVVGCKSGEEGEEEVGEEVQ
ncbi:hypothetical protein BC938DRAFT_482205 [Jimgerdemannia flammicorona]|uniref:FAS1 domain-containing protein n=1 Tax=Jimgerdemannia flammicorona TaxID=994334 RepID=A0A433QEH1_9FUNG|nr:hypothetical protein BC938DRAFT_482205 [Jimgerdemannia flammicorona]